VIRETEVIAAKFDGKHADNLKRYLPEILLKPSERCTIKFAAANIAKLAANFSGYSRRRERC
jgi:hypothetical protein